MISDCQIKNELIELWESIDKLEKRFKPLKYIAAGTIIEERGSPDESYNLLLVLAYSALDELLSQCILEGMFTSSQPNNRFQNLGTKMDDSKNDLNWIDYQSVYDGKEIRNNLAHQSELANKEECLKYVEAIRREFIGWGILN